MLCDNEDGQLQDEERGLEQILPCQLPGETNFANNLISDF